MNMEAPPPKSPKNKLEVAFAAYLKSLADDRTHPLSGLNFYASQSKAKKQLPAVILFCEEAEEITPESKVYEGDLFAYLLTQKDDESSAVHDERLHEIQDSLSDLETVKGALNFPGTTGERPVPDFHIYGYFESKAKADGKDRHFGEAVRYRVTWAGFDRQ